MYPFGYSWELCLWAFVFAMGPGISFHEGWPHVRSPKLSRSSTVNYVDLGVAFLLKGSSWTIEVKGICWAKSQIGWWDAIESSKDPANFIVLFEDSAASAGFLVAALGIWASYQWADPRIDGVASSSSA